MIRRNKHEKQKTARHAEPLRTEQDVRLRRKSKLESGERFFAVACGAQVREMSAKKHAGKSLRSPFDENGSYTGVPADGGKPVQDADDL